MLYFYSGDAFGDFVISNASTSSLTIATTRPLDYEKKSFYSLYITAVNTEEQGAKNTTIIFNVTVIDLNDNPPSFQPSIVRASVPENLAVGSMVVKMTAVDPDSPGFAVITYSIISNLTRSIFEINSTTGVISLMKSLDRETEDTYFLIVLAKDQLYSAVAEVVLNVADVNDNRPKFSPETYSLNVVENIPTASSIVQVFASDPDLGFNASMSFSISAGNNEGYFSINSTTGVVTLVKALDYERNTSFTLVVSLVDQGSPVLQASVNATITINVLDVNDNFAQFETSLYTARIAENTNLSTSVLQVKTIDKDGTTLNKNLTFSINQTLASNFFMIDQHTGVISVKAKLDYESVREYHFSVLATDSGVVPHVRHTNIIIYITDANDERPYFKPTSYNVTVSEFARPGALAVHLFGFDNDTTKSLQYSIISQTPKQDFSIDQSSGALVVQQVLDRENITMYVLSIALSDGVNSAATPATVTVYISDENDNRPVFVQSQYTKSMYENATVGATVVTVQSTDADMGSNAALTYSILYTGLNDSSLFFSINSSTGVISLAKALNYEMQKVHHFAVMVTDGGVVPLRQHVTVEVIVLDINDNAPYFMPQMYTAVIPESMNIGNIVAVIKAMDNDSVLTQLTYSIVDGNADNYFSLMPSMPNVIVTSKMLDYEAMHHFVLKIRAFDGSSFSTTNATVEINVTDVNDRNPIFNPTYYKVTIPEDTNSSYVILQVTATDVDGTAANNGIRYSALENTTDFSVNPITGEITAVNINYERAKEYSLVVVAQDSGAPSRLAYALVDIIISDINDNPPVVLPVSYKVNVSEAALVGVVLARITATDADSGTRGQLVYSIVAGNSASLFAIKSDTGDVTLNGALNYEGKFNFLTVFNSRYFIVVISNLEILFSFPPPFMIRKGR